ncbi:hypothetical protein CGRA01v4_14667 [Colletotrichum graminicola]|nr:hypothetical protein CGRA01v4_14667 [Colletotrichum graminicola]
MVVSGLSHLISITWTTFVTFIGAGWRDHRQPSARCFHRLVVGRMVGTKMAHFERLFLPITN